MAKSDARLRNPLTSPKYWIARSSRAMTSWLLLRPSLLCRLLRSLLRDLRALRPRLGQPDRDRLLAAGHLLAGPAAFQRAGLALFHYAFDVGGSSLRIFCHALPPGYWKIILGEGVGSPQCRPHRRQPEVSVLGDGPMLIPSPQPIPDARLGQHELRALGVGLDLLPQLADINPQILRVGQLVPQ